MLKNASIVHWYPNLEPHHCGYCKKSDGSITHGLWAERLTVEDYQELIDRGWRRSGKYLYKPVLDVTCCPQYTIRCEALNFQLSKSQKKVIKNFNKFLIDGSIQNRDSSRDDGNDVSHENDNIYMQFDDMPEPKEMEPSFELKSEELTEKSVSSDLVNCASTSKHSLECMEIEDAKVKGKTKEIKKGLGPDSSKPLCKKAKILRMERKLQRAKNSPVQNTKNSPKKTQQTKSLSDFLEISDQNNFKHKFRLSLVSEGSRDWENTKEQEYEVYFKYQTIVHDEKASSLNMKGFLRFLVNNPFKEVPKTTIDEDKPHFGAYHQQYWLDDKLIAVGVIDILPKCISSVYFFYDPDYRSLIMGTYGFLREVQYVQRISKQIPSIQYYYMGYYIHSCQKMRYKGKLRPSFLLCPETFRWVPIELCLNKLDANKYARLEEDKDAKDTSQCSLDDMNSMQIISDYRLCSFRNFRHNRDQLKLLAKLVGRRCIGRLFIVMQ